MFIRLCSIFFSSHLIYGFLNNKTTTLRVSHIKKNIILMPFHSWIIFKILKKYNIYDFEIFKK